VAKDFVLVRIVQMRGVDTNLFQFDWDSSWSSMFLTPDLAVLGRYGSRRDGGDSLFQTRSLTAAMKRALEVYKGYPKNKASLAGKTGKPYPWKTPETMPSIEVQFRSGAFPKNCIHCHHVWKGVKRSMMMEKKAVPENLVYPFPMPDTIGMAMSEADGVTVESVAAGTPAAKAGIAAQDEIQSINGQPIVSTADIQWVLHTSPDSTALKVEVARGAEKKTLTVALSGPWRHYDFTWRCSTGDMRLGMQLDPLADDERPKFGLRAGGLKVKNAWPQGPAGRAGFKPGDVLLAINGQPVPATEHELLCWIRKKYLPGTKLKITAVMGGKRQDLNMDLP
jgi:hypothetical protein